MTAADLGRIAVEARVSPEFLREVERFYAVPNDPHRDPKTQFNDPSDLAETGWGVMFTAGTPAEVRRALAPLLEMRSQQAGHRFREIEPAPPGKPLGRPGVVDPDLYPYYVLVVGRPDEYTFAEVATHDVQYAVGRLCFTTPDGKDHDVRAYRRYVENLERFEWARPRRRLGLFAPREEGRATGASDGDDSDVTAELSATTAKIAERFGRSHPGWTIEALIGPTATRAALAEILSDRVPDLLFTACHGLSLACGDPDQLAEQGALVCQPDADGADAWFSAADLAPGVDLRGLISVHLTCYGLGTPEQDGFALHAPGGGERLTERPFVARLPQALLEAGARAVIGHVDRAWTSSLFWPNPDDPPAIWLALLDHLARGVPVGHALQLFHHGAGDLALQLNALWKRRAALADVDLDEFAHLFCSTEDAAGFQVLGDPAVRLATIWT